MYKNKHIGSLFDEFLKEEGLYDDVTAVAIKRVVALQIEQEMNAQDISRD